MHPLVGNLTALTEEELNKKIIDLQSRYSIAYRSGNYNLMTQIQMILEHYTYERGIRNDKLLADMQSKSKQFKDLIDIQ